MATTSSLCLLLAIILPTCFAQRIQWELQGQNPWQPGARQQGRWRHRQQQFREECDIWSLTAAEPFRRIESEAGVSEYWDPTQQQFRCAGVVVIRHVIEPKGLLLPNYANAPHVTYVVQGRGLFGATIPGCPQTFQSETRFEKGSERRFRDEHQRIRRFREGDVLALPAGVTKWVYNDGDSRAIAITVFDTSNFQNQLDENLRLFLLAGSRQMQEIRGERREAARHLEEGRNIFSGFDQELLAEALGVNVETVNKLQGQNDQRGNIVFVERSLQFLSPEFQEEEIRREELEREERHRGRDNGLEETFCSLKLRHNINAPSETDIFNPRGGRITALNSNKLPILNFLQLSAYRVVLYEHATVGPFWTVNAHSICYVTRGRGRIQIVRDNGRLVLDQEVQEGQLFVVPQNFVVIKKASREGLEYVAFKTSDNAVVSHLAGRTSALRSLPVEVLANSYLISRETALHLKQSRRSVAVFGPHSISRREEERERAATISDNE
ncbi:13S globulin seed storage protein-like protein [Drosera capensis]